MSNLSDTSKENIGTDGSHQYDANHLVGVYSERSLEIQDADPGRQFLYQAVSAYPTTSNILDIGCGSGIDMRKYKELGFSSVYGIDVSEGFVQEGKNEFGERISVGRFEEINSPSENFDIVTARFSLHYVKNIEQALSEIVRILKPGGKFAFVVSHPNFDALDKINENGNVYTTLFGGAIEISFPLHSLDEYLGSQFQKYFRLIGKSEYIGNERDKSNKQQDGVPNALCVIGEKVE